MSSPTASFTAVNETTGNSTITEIKKEKRPDMNTMEGMIYNADEILQKFFDPNIKSEVPRNLLKSCVGIVLLKSVEAGFFISGSVGTGILLKRQASSASGNEWSYPVACGLTSVGWGLIFGGSVKDIIVFILDQDTLKNLVYDKVGIRLGGQLEATLGPVGRAGNLDLTVSEKGIGNTVSYAFTQGALVGVYLQGSVVGARHKVNSNFYKRSTAATSAGTLTSVTADEIFSGANLDMEAITKHTKLQDVYTKLNLITSSDSAAAAPVPTLNLHHDEPDIDFVEAPPAGATK